MNNEEAKRQMRQGKRLRHADVEDDCFLFIDPLTGDVMFADLHGTYCEVASESDPHTVERLSKGLFSTQ